LANEELQINASIVDNVSTVVQKIIKNLRTLETNVADLADVFQDLVSTQNKYGQSTEKVAKQAAQAATAITDIDKAASKARSSVQEIAKAFEQPGFEAISKLKLDSLNQLSSSQIVDLNKRLRESNLTLEEFVGKGRGIANISAEVAYASKAIKTLDITLRSLADSDLGKILSPLTEIPSELRALENVANFDSLRNGAIAAQNETTELQRRLREIGPAARSGDQGAVKELKLLEQQVDENIVKSNQLTRALRQSLSDFDSYAKEANRSLRNLGFNEIRAQDIFPTQQLQELQQVRDSIQRAIRQSVEVGAVRTTFQNFFPNALIDNAKDFDQNIVNLASHLPRLRYATYDISNNLGIFGASLIAAGGAALKFGIDYERAFADVQRTTGVAGAEAEKLRRNLVDLSTEIPVAFADLAQIATLAGQLNIANSVVDEFTSSVARFAATTDVTVEAAATAFGRLDQLIFGVNGRFEQLGSSILKVGVNAVATESEIINISTQIASIANVAGFSASELIGLSAALASVGTRPELSRGTFTRLFTEVQQAAAEGGAQLDAFARISGYSSDEFQAAWGAGSGAEIVIRLLRGLNEEGQAAQASLAQIGITSVRDVPTLLKLAQSVEEVEKQIAIANLGFIEGTELQNQYSVISSTTAEKLKLLSNTFGALVENVSGATGPLSLVLDGLIGLLKFIDRLVDNPVGRFVLGLVAAFTALAGVVSLFLAGAARLAGGFLGAATASIETRTALGLVGIALDDLTTSTKINTLVTAENISVQEAQQFVALESSAAIKAETIATNENTVAAGANAGANNNLRGALVNLTKQSKAATIATKALTAAGWIGAILVGTQIVYEIGRAFGIWGEEINGVTDEIDNFGEFQQALVADTEAYNNANVEQRKNFKLLTLDISDTKNEVSDYAKIIFNAAGDTDQLNAIIDETTGALDRQTVAIGENTRELLRRQFVQDLVAESERFDAERFARDIEVGGGGPAGGPAAFVPQLDTATFVESAEALSEIFASPALLDLLTQAGFDFTQFMTILTTQGEAAANVYAEQFNPAIEQVIATLQSKNPELFAESIEALTAAQQSGLPVLTELIGRNGELQRTLAETALEAIANGDALSNAEDDYQNFADALKATFDELYGPINADNAATRAVRELGAAFAQETPGVVANSQEMQSAIFAVIDSAASPDEAIAGLQGLYAAILDGGYASREELEILGSQIIETYRIAAQAQLELLKTNRAALAVTGRNFGQIAGNLSQARALDEQIVAQEKAIKNIDQIAVGTANSAQYANDLAQGYSNANRAAGGTADAVEEIEEETKQAVRTLLDYASDLENVFSRAFDIRFGRTFALDDIAESFDALSKSVEDARFELDELQASQSDLSADRGLKEYFLSIAEAYNDTLRAAKLREEIAALDREQAENTQRLEEAQAIAGGDLAGQGSGQRQNRQALLGLVQNYQDYIKVLAESGAGQDELRAATAQARAEFIQQATELGFQEDIVLQYAQAFDDVTFAINNVPRNITIEFDANPALQALRELNAKLDESIEKTKKLNQLGGVERDPDPVIIVPTTTGSQRAEDLRFERLRTNNRLYSTGGFTGRGGKMEPAGIVHRGEYVVPKQFVNQSTGMPDASFLAQLQNGVRSFAVGGFAGPVGGGDGTVMVELSPFDRKLLSDAGNVQLRLNGKVVAEATNRSNFNDAQRGTN
jgi:TP901 family phage tail tape measure protein